MRRALGLLFSTVLLGGSAVVLDGCKDKSAGDSIGTYSVVATRTQNGCGTQMAQKLASATFNVNLAVNDATLTWTLDGQSGVTGTYNAALGTFNVQSETSIQEIAADTRTGTVGCVLHRTDIIEGAVTVTPYDGGVSDANVAVDGGGNGMDAGAVVTSDAGADGGVVVTSFTATETISYGTESGDCTAVIGVGAGQALTLPCVEGYQFTATRTGN